MVNIKNKLQEYMPSLLKFLDKEPISWNRINSMFQVEFMKRKAQYVANDNHLIVEASIYDILSATLDGNKSAERLFTFLNSLIEELIVQIPKEHLGKMKRTVYNILTSFNKDYLNFVGELAVLNILLRSKLYILEDIEYPIENGKTVDFKFYSKEEAKSILVEVYNIHPTKEISTNPDEINKFLSKRINDKINLKMKDINNPVDFLLAPVIWTQASDLERINSFYKSGRTLDIYSSSEPFAFICYYNSKTNLLIHKFGQISTLFDP